MRVGLRNQSFLVGPISLLQLSKGGQSTEIALRCNLSIMDTMYDVSIMDTMYDVSKHQCSLFRTRLQVYVMSIRGSRVRR